MQNFDAAIIGAGPAGCQCARELSREGKQVLLIEKAKSFAANNFSSGGAPLAIMKEYQLPDDVVGVFWNKFAIHSSNSHHLWESPEKKGVVFDFMKLRSFMAEDAQNRGCQLRLHTSYISHRTANNQAIVELKDHKSGRTESITAKVLVDATGTERKVLAGSSYDTSKALEATGIEYVIEAPPSIYERYAETLSFFFGQKWMPHGYAWIFPMPNYQLKMGVIRYFPHEFLDSENTYKFYLSHLIESCLGTKDPHIIERHGKTLYYTYGQKDPRFFQNVVAIGDSISLLNPLASEGIRHAMASGRISACHILGYLQSPEYDMSQYSRDIRQYCGFKWKVSEFLMKNIYHHSSDKKIDLFLKSVSHLSFDDLLRFGFDYQFLLSFKFYLHYLSHII